MVAAVTFDVWETLITDPPELSQARSASRIRQMVEALARSGRPVAESDLLLAYERSWEVYERYWDRNEDISTAEQLEILLGLVDSTLMASLDTVVLGRVTAAYVDPLFEFPPAMRDGVPDVLRELKQRGCKVGLICNTGRTPGWAVRRLLGTYGVLDFFDAMAFSNEERIRKPAAPIFLRVLGTLDVPAQRAVHVGDNIVTDVAGAKGVGMRAVLIGNAVPDGALVAPDLHITTLAELVPALMAAEL